MTSAPARPRLVELDERALVDRLAEALQIYVAAMGYPPGTARQRRPLWLDHMRRPGWRAVGWIDPADLLLGIAYGYDGGPGQWWYEEVRRGVQQRAELALPDDYFELTELHVRPDAQGTGLGEGLLRALLEGAQSGHVLLSTPEHGPRPPGRAWRLYRRLGFRDVLREHLFTGDSRPFAVLGRTLPLPPPAHPPGTGTPPA